MVYAMPGKCPKCDKDTGIHLGRAINRTGGHRLSRAQRESQP